MSYDNLRFGRFSQRDQIYSVTCVTQNREPVFFNLMAARILINEIRILSESGYVSSLAFVVMPDHLHWLLQMTSELNLSDVMKRLKARSALKVNKKLKRQGSVWQRAFYDHAVRREEDLLGVAGYIVANPARAGLVTNLADYPHWDCVWPDLLVE